MFNHQDLDRVPLRCQRLLMRMMRFRAKAENVSGKQLVVADTLSRNCLSVPPETTSDTEEEVRAYVDAAEMVPPASPEKMERIKQATSSDPQLSCVLNCVVNGWPKNASDVPQEIRPYYAVRGDLSVTDGKIINQNRLVIPPVLQSEVLERIHDGHQGITKCRERANMSVSMCDFCQANLAKSMTSSILPLVLIIHKQMVNRKVKFALARRY